MSDSDSESSVDENEIERLQTLLREGEKTYSQDEKAKHQLKSVTSKYYSKHISRIVFCQKIFRRRQQRKQYLKIKKMIWRRNLIAQEILETERTYVKNLNTLATAFLQPLCNHPKAGKRGAVKSMLSSIEVIKGYNTIILNSLTLRLEKWSEHTKIGDIFLQIAQYLKAYTQYSTLYTQCLEELDQLTQKDKKFGAYMEELRLAPGVAETNMYMRDFLIMPIQRIPRYTLLLKDLLEHTWTSHADYESLKSGFDKISEIARFVNKAQAENSNNIRMQAIKASLSGPKSKTFSLLQPHRRFIMEGEVVENTMSGSERISYLFLFNDVLLWTKANSQKTKFDLFRIDLFPSYLSIKQISQTTTTNPMKTIAIYEKERISFFRPTSDDFEIWFQNLSLYVSEALSQPDSNAAEMRTKQYLQSQKTLAETPRRAITVPASLVLEQGDKENQTENDQHIEASASEPGDRRKVAASMIATSVSISVIPDRKGEQKGGSAIVGSLSVGHYGRGRSSSGCGQQLQPTTSAEEVSSAQPELRTHSETDTDPHVVGGPASGLRDKDGTKKKKSPKMRKLSFGLKRDDDSPSKSN